MGWAEGGAHSVWLSVVRVKKPLGVSHTFSAFDASGGAFRVTCTPSFLSNTACVIVSGQLARRHGKAGLAYHAPPPSPLTPRCSKCTLPRPTHTPRRDTVPGSNVDAIQ